MDFCIQDPTYSDSKYLHETLISEFENSKRGAGVYAFVSKDGLKLIFEDESFKKFIKNGTYTLIIGMDDITNPKALQKLIELKQTYGKRFLVKAYIHNKRGSIFHPKYSWFEKDNGGSCVIGSGNLTSSGLRYNREAYGYIDLDKKSFTIKILNEWIKWLKHSEKFLLDIEDPRVLARAKQNVTSIKAVIKAKKDINDVANGDLSALTELFEQQPKSLIYKTNTEKQEPINNYEENKMNIDSISEEIDVDTNIEQTHWTISKFCEVLIAEIPKSGNRWKQVNFDKSSFETYFGATCGENGSYRILLRSIDENLNLGNIEIRPSVSVASQNYRFELEAASGLDYPKDGKRPIVIFGKVSKRDFLYELLMPNNKNYDKVINFLNRKDFSSNGKMRRLAFSGNDIIDELPNLGLWSKLRKDD